jgi:hypothetical protein
MEKVERRDWWNMKINPITGYRIEDRVNKEKKNE